MPGITNRVGRQKRIQKHIYKIAQSKFKKEQDYLKDEVALGIGILS